MKETSKSIELRKKLKHFEYYLKGKGIDVGAGNDPLSIENGFVDIWDMPNGDAQYLRGINNNYYDFLYSSHCLEHLVDIKESLKNWARVVKPLGFLYIVVPDWERYELFNWPSKFNRHHKHTFSLDYTRKSVNRNNHWHISDLKDIANELNLELISFSIEDENYDYSNKTKDQTLGNALAQIRIIFIKN